MFPVRAGLLTFLLVSLVTVALGLSPNYSLFAQEQASTPTPVPYNELPICPPVTSDPSVPTPLPDITNLGEPQCRLETEQIVDVKELIEHGEDPAKYGIPGDPPTEDPDARAESSDTPNQSVQLYLPLMDSGATTSSELESSSNSIEDEEIPYDELPICPEIPPIDSTKLPPPDDSKPVCRLQTTMIVDVKKLIEQGEDPAKYGIPGDPQTAESPLAQASSIAMPNSTFEYSWAQHDLAISSTPYVYSVLGIVSNMGTGLAAGKSWNDFHYYNRITLGSNTTNGGCGQLDKFTLGGVRGKIGSNTFSTPTIVYGEFTNHVCGVFSSPVSVVNSAAVRIRRIAANTWQGEVWTGSWYVVFSSTTT